MERMLISTGLDYFDRLARMNGLAGPKALKPVFEPGMLFDSRKKWWAGSGRRQTAHEGLDICLYQRDGGPVEHIGSGLKVPVVWPGEVVKTCDDFLGRTVILSHGRETSDGKELLSLYAHLQPAEEIGPGNRLTMDGVVGSVAKVDPQTSRLLPHLHLSILWNRKPFVYNHLQWSQLSRRQGVVFVDPLPWINAGRSFSIESGTTAGVK